MRVVSDLDPLRVQFQVKSDSGRQWWYAAGAIEKASGGGGGGSGTGVSDVSGAIAMIRDKLGDVCSTWPNAGWDDGDEFSSSVTRGLQAGPTASSPCTVSTHATSWHDICSMGLC